MTGFAASWVLRTSGFERSLQMGIVATRFWTHYVRMRLSRTQPNCCWRGCVIQGWGLACRLAVDRGQSLDQLIPSSGLLLSIVVMGIALVAQRRLASALMPTVLWLLLVLSGRVAVEGYSPPLLHTLAITAPLVLLGMWSLYRLRASKGYWVALPIVAAVLMLSGLVTVTLDLTFD